MVETLTSENILRRVIVRPDNRFLEFYTEPGVDQPMNPDAEKAEVAFADPETALPSIESKDHTSHV